jgi:3-methyladenine DNA glycosylase AlkD
MGKEEEIILAQAGKASKNFRKEMRKIHDPERAIKEKQYLKSPYRFFGVSVPFLRKLANTFKRNNKDASREFIYTLSETLWQGQYHQEKSLAIILLEQYPDFLDNESIPFIESILGSCNGWDHADWTAINLMGEVLNKDLSMKRHLVRWSGAWSLWLRRASLIAQIKLLRKGEGDRELFYRIARSMTYEKEFFIRKAIGWTVREISKSDEVAARDFLLEIKKDASGLTLREGSKRLPATMKEEVLKAG